MRTTHLVAALAGSCVAALAATDASPPAMDACAEKCYTTYNECRVKPNANRSTCTSDFVSCLGFNPFGGDGTLITPTACSTTATSTATDAAPPAMDACAEKCYTTYNECRVKPNANRSTCASDFMSCLGFNPFGGDGTLITPTACSTTANSTTTTLSPDSKPTTAPLPPSPGQNNTTTPLPGAAAQARPLVAMLALAALAVY